ncbi:trehalose-phosphatase [Jannaschia aquimarina]|uniref:Trehalose 6-phosphate phosphatase n=1 Tax=Jannaschia aquimarina TaxID=935700 RepID=A0A0D1EKH1_9RHOB|nr:trehalose-phosphatase [Jannaschia aquimarina]KIT17521.1 Trehalose-6-phosphate phosphatase [Jannaschia aquimarina]SNS73835.1 trehalose 6-phosphatase [Jannaschia aquimarina]
MLYYELTGFMTPPKSHVNSGAFDLPPPEETALLLDFDGTLVEIAERPMEVRVSDRVVRLLDRAQERLQGRIALISGRTIEDLEHFLPSFDGPLVGIHGTEYRIEGEREVSAKVDAAIVSRLHRLVEDFVALRPEFVAETKPSGVVLHYRQAEDKAAHVMKFMEALACAAQGFKLQPALMAYEIKPEGVGKDTAVQHLMELPAFEGHKPIYAGDDLTDEAGIKAAQALGGLGIKIGDAESAARHRLATPSDLIDLLEHWLA